MASRLTSPGFLLMMRVQAQPDRILLNLPKQKICHWRCTQAQRVMLCTTSSCTWSLSPESTEETFLGASVVRHLRPYKGMKLEMTEASMDQLLASLKLPRWLLTCVRVRPLNLWVTSSPFFSTSKSLAGVVSFLWSILESCLQFIIPVWVEFLTASSWPGHPQLS